MNTHTVQAHRKQPLNAQALDMLKQFPDSEPMPAIFFGHGSPMFAINDTVFGRKIQSLSSQIPTPSAILCISAHWETRGTWLTAMPQPRTIHDFGGFPQALFDVQYPAAGSVDLANATAQMITVESVGLDDHEWGLDHGTWSVLRHLYPQANIPVVQLSLDHYKTPEAHYALAQQLSALRRKGVLIIGSGNIVHNLRMLDWNRSDTEAFGFDWALETDEKVKQAILSGNHDYLIDYRNNGKGFDMAIPTAEHYLPLLYTLAVQEAADDVMIFNEQATQGSLTMTSVAIGLSK